MKRNFIWILALQIFFSLTVYSQSYKELITQADSLYNSKDYKKADKLYKKAFKIDQTNLEDIYNAACVESLAGKKTRAFQLLHLFVELALETDLPGNITDTGEGDPDLIPLHNDKRWTEFKDYVYKMID